jgi:hypothetical protein
VAIEDVKGVDGHGGGDAVVLLLFLMMGMRFIGLHFSPRATEGRPLSQCGRSLGLGNRDYTFKLLLLYLAIPIHRYLRNHHTRYSTRFFELSNTSHAPHLRHIISAPAVTFLQPLSCLILHRAPRPLRDLLLLRGRTTQPVDKVPGDIISAQSPPIG